MRSATHCLLKDREITDSACADMILDLDADSLAKCRTDCPRGVALAKSTANWRGTATTVDSAVAACLAPVTKPPTAWELVVKATGHTSQGRLADALHTNQPKISQMFIKLGKGHMPSGKVWDDLLELSGLSAQVLLAAATGKPIEQAPGESSPGPLRNCRTAFSSQPPAPPVSSPPMPSDPVDLPPAAPEGTSGHMMSMPDASDKTAGSEAASEDLPPLSQHLMDAAELDAADTVPTLMGADPAEQLMDTEELAELRKPAAIPADFVPYTGARPSIISLPALSIKKGGDIELSSGAVESFGLSGKRLVRPHWSATSKRIGLALVEHEGAGVLKLQPTTRSQRLRISGGGFFRAFGLDLEPGTYPLALDPSGLLVATITNAPAQPGGEA